MTTRDEGNAVLKKAVDDAIEATSRPDIDNVCKAHDPLRMGVNVLLLCKKDDMEREVSKERPAFESGSMLSYSRKSGLRVTGWAAVIAVLVGGLVYYGRVVADKLEAKTEVTATHVAFLKNKQDAYATQDRHALARAILDEIKKESKP